MTLVLMAWLVISSASAWSGDDSEPVIANNSDIYGLWRIVKVVGVADIAAMSDREARALIGKPVEIGKRAFVFGGEKCEEPTYERITRDLVQSFREESHASVAGMGLPDPVTSVDARCTHIFLKRPGVIVIHWNGYYFDAVRRGGKR
ncbi:hypothetical protein GJ699_15685 [Duganella sp. FT80W]|uniref:Lipocalin-like domain-containing protein n=1 Tax=Duganella guangzhouensis TaxID=2666084 RepID=A0A6I2L0Q1_9BURK|nr:hypothetical protein [Duganella guangzhouensis]MRW91433.1 hypothetical protein [Duganella guangzhouensis]